MKYSITLEVECAEEEIIGVKEQIAEIVRISREAFDTDIEVGADEAGGPPDYDSVKWHESMQTSGNLFVLTKDDEIIGGALLFEDKKENNVLYVGRIFIDPKYHKKGFGKELMRQIEQINPEKKFFRLDTPVWNRRTNSFYPQCGYQEMYRDEESVYYQKVLE